MEHYHETREMKKEGKVTIHLSDDNTRIVFDHCTGARATPISIMIQYRKEDVITIRDLLNEVIPLMEIESNDR